MKRIATAILVAMLVSLAGCDEAQRGGSTSVAEPEAGKPEAGRSGFDFVAEPRRFPKPKTCSDYASRQEILADERAGKLTKDDKLWLDMDGDGRYCEGRNVVWKGERTQAE